jgi:hypothetical protein
MHSMIDTVAAVGSSAVCAVGVVVCGALGTAGALVVGAFAVEAVTHGLIRLRYAHHARLLDEGLVIATPGLAPTVRRAVPRSHASAPPCYAGAHSHRAQEGSVDAPRTRRRSVPCVMPG